MYEATQLKRQRLESKGYTVVTKWECDWDREVKYNKALQEFLASYELVEPLNPRDAFFGGRTNAVRLHHEANESKGEKLKYVDVTSLYPWVNKKKIYPVGHPVIIRSPEVQNINDYFGMAKVDVLPPSLLYHPVLPLRHGGKLAFPLCTKCVEGQMLKPLLEKSCKRSHQRIIHASCDMVPSQLVRLDSNFIPTSSNSSNRCYTLTRTWYFILTSQASKIFLCK